MGRIASELLVERLIDSGVDTVFGLPDDGCRTGPASRDGAGVRARPLAATSGRPRPGFGAQPGEGAPSLHLYPACGVPDVRHLEYFANPVRALHLRFDGGIRPKGGVLEPDLSAPGLGLDLRRADADRYGTTD